MGNHRPNPEDDLVFTADRAEIRGSSGARHLSRARRAQVEAEPNQRPGTPATARCGAAGWLTASSEPIANGHCAACFRDLPEVLAQARLDAETLAAESARG